MSRFARNTRELAFILAGVLLISGCMRKSENTANAASEVQQPAEEEYQPESDAPQLRLMQCADFFAGALCRSVADRVAQDDRLCGGCVAEYGAGGRGQI